MDDLKCRPNQVISKLKYNINTSDFLTLEVCLKTRDPFKSLVATILTQNTSDKSAKKAFDLLESKVGVTPSNLSNADLEVIKFCIKSIGLYNNKSITIRELARFIQETYHGDINKLLDVDPELARKELTRIKGIGNKTVDVVLLTCKGYKTFPVDTHIFRISKRLGIKGNYKVVSEFWKNSVYDTLNAHLILITHGRKTCKAINPKCESCKINDCCRYYDGLRGS
ncbi:MAG: endonuclease III [Metallosphaera sp.]